MNILSGGSRARLFLRNPHSRANPGQRRLYSLFLWKLPTASVRSGYHRSATSRLDDQTALTTDKGPAWHIIKIHKCTQIDRSNVVSNDYICFRFPLRSIAPLAPGVVGNKNGRTRNRIFNLFALFDSNDFLPLIKALYCSKLSSKGYKNGSWKKKRLAHFLIKTLSAEPVSYFHIELPLIKILSFSSSIYQLRHCNLSSNFGCLIDNV